MASDLPTPHVRALGTSLLSLLTSCLCTPMSINFHIPCSEAPTLLEAGKLPNFPTYHSCISLHVGHALAVIAQDTSGPAPHLDRFSFAGQNRMGIVLRTGEPRSAPLGWAGHSRNSPSTACQGGVMMQMCIADSYAPLPCSAGKSLPTVCAPPTMGRGRARLKGPSWPRARCLAS